MIPRTLRKVPGTKDYASSCRIKPARQWWCHRKTFRFEDEVGAEEEGRLCWSCGISLCFSPFACRKEELPRTMQQHSVGVKTADTCHGDRIGTIIKLSPYSCLLHVVRKEKLRASTPNWTDLIGDQTNTPCQSKTLPSDLDSRASSQKMMFLDEPMAKTGISRQVDSWMSRAQQPPSSSLFLSSTRRRRRKISRPTRTRILKARSFQKMSRFSLEDLPYLLMEKKSDCLPFKFLIPKKSVHDLRFSTCQIFKISSVVAARSHPS